MEHLPNRIATRFLLSCSVLCLIVFARDRRLQKKRSILFSQLCIQLARNSLRKEKKRKSK